MELDFFFMCVMIIYIFEIEHVRKVNAAFT